MDKHATFFPAFEIKSRGTDSIFRELCQPADYKKLSEGGWKEAFVNQYGQMMADAPNIRKLASRLINEGLVAKGYAAVDPERVFFNTFTDGYKNAGDTKYRHTGNQLIASYSLTDTAIFDIFTKEWWNTWNELGNDRTNGIYTAGRGVSEWGPSNILPFSSKVVADILYYDKSVVRSYPGEFSKFWDKHAGLYRDFLADSFLASALIQYRSRLLTDEGFAVLRGLYYGQYPEGCKVIKLDVYGYYSSDILCVFLGQERMFLYIPGANMPFREFVSLKEMKSWIAEQLRVPAWREVFANHFAINDRWDGSSYYGVDSVLRFMAEGNSNWDPQRFIIYGERTYDLNQDLFGAMRDQVRGRTESDKGQDPKLGAPRFIDYVLEFGSFFLAQASMIGMILPQAPVLFDIDACHTPLGLSSTWVVNASKLADPHQAQGPKVQTDTFKALESLRVFTIMADRLRVFSRPAAEIPAFGSEAQAMTARFGLTETQQAALKPGDEPAMPLQGQPAQIRLVRLMNDQQPLAVIRRFAGNQYQLLDTVSLAVIEGQWVSEVTDEESGQTFYTANGYFRGYLPYQPYRFAFEYLWTPARFSEKLGTGGVGALEVNQVVYAQLERIHTAVALRQCQEAALTIQEAVDNYRAGGTNLPYQDTLSTVALQVIDLFFPQGLGLLQRTLSEALPQIGATAAAHLCEAGIEEVLGENAELTASLLRYARQDDIIPLRSGGYKAELASQFAYPPLFVIPSLAEFDALPTSYFLEEPYRTMGLTDNRSVLIAALQDANRHGLLQPLLIYENGLYIGCEYQELVHTITEGSCNADTEFGVHPLTVLRMLQELAGETDLHGAGLVAKYAVPSYYKMVANRRMRKMWEVYHLTENFDFTAWDTAYGESFQEGFDVREDETPEQAILRQIGLLLQGRGCALPANAAGVGFFLDHLQTFLDAGVTAVGVTSLYREIIQEDMDEYAQGYITGRLKATWLSLDNGVANGPFRRLFETARARGLSLSPLGQLDGSVAEELNGYTHLYFRGGTLLNALRQFGETGKVVVFTHQYMMFPTPGLNAPLPGLTQCLNIPGAWVDDLGVLRHYADSLNRPVLMDAEVIKEMDDDFLPVWNDQAIDPSDDLAYLMPEDGKVLGLKMFGGINYIFPSIEGRANLLRDLVGEAAWPALREHVSLIKELVSELATNQMTSGSEQAFEVNRLLETAGYQPGNGVTLTWCIREKDKKDYSFYHHLAPTVLIDGNEYVVDVTHCQFFHAMDEETIFLPIPAWADEICNRASALNPYLAYSLKMESELAGYYPFPFIMPRVPRVV